MPRYAIPQKTPIEPTIEGDTAFNRVDMKRDRSLLEPGTLALSVNKRLRKGNAETRKGIWPPTFANVMDFESIKGIGSYSNPNGNEVLLVAAGSNIYSLRDGNFPVTLPIDGSLADSVEFVQAHDKVLVFQGEDTLQLVWDGVSADGFQPIEKSEPTDTSTSLIPKAQTAEHVSDRLVMISGTNDIIVTDILDYTSYDPLLEVFHISREAGDPIVRLFNYAKGMLLVFCKRSVSILLNFTGDPALAQVELLNSTLGLAGRKAVVMVGGDVLFLSNPGGIYRIAQAFESRLQTVPLPITDAIQPLIDRINWQAASGAVAAVLGEYVRFFVPIDGSTRNNCAIVYNAATDVIEGYDTWPESFMADEVVKTIYMGQDRLFAVDKEKGSIYVLDEGKSDFIRVPGTDVISEYEIEDVIETRGYSTLGWNAATRRDFKRVEIGVSTWAPSIVVTELTERAGDERGLNVTPITKSRTEYDTFGRKNWTPTNENDDWGTPGRQDYSLTTDTTGFLLGADGIDFDRQQAANLRFSTKARGKYISYRIANSQGRCDVCWIYAESSGTQREPRRAG